MCVATWITPAQGQDSSIPSWRLGIPTFSGKKSAAESAAEAPAFQFPPPGGVAASPVQNAQANNDSDAMVIPVDYKIDSLDLGPALNQAATDALSLPTPPLPNSAYTDPTNPIGQAIASGNVVEQAPLSEETRSWYEVPWQWISRGWKNHAELGLNGSDGNSKTVAFQTGLEMKRKTDTYTLELDFDYRKATNRGETTEDNGRLNLDYDRLLKDSKWSLFGKFGAEWDQFKAFDSRLNLNSGVGYHFIRNDDTTLVTRFGAGASKEIGAPDDDWKAEAVFGLQAEHQLNRYNKMKAKVDYFPAWEDFSDYRMVSDVSWEILLDDSDNLSLKLGLTDRYDSTPQGALPNDIFYSLLLLVKF